MINPTLSLLCTMYKCLHYFNFGPSIINWIKTLYTDFKCKIINNGELSDTVHLKRGLKQGCPLSPYLFILSIEILGQKVRNNSNIKGLTINNIESKVTMYADDTNSTIMPTENSTPALTDDLDPFSKISGLKPNYDKCTIRCIGSLENMQLPTNFPIRWTNGPVNILGICIPEKLSNITKVNFESKLQKVEKILSRWTGKSMTLSGKVALINSLIIPQFTCYLLYPPIRKNCLKNMNREYLHLYGITNQIKSKEHIYIIQMKREA